MRDFANVKELVDDVKERTVPELLLKALDASLAQAMRKFREVHRMSQAAVRSNLAHQKEAPTLPWANLCLYCPRARC